ncbi:uncharacterized protein LOC18432553 [Amborella trichopoda]|uniref:GDP-fucose protein O-fucosyltransferase 2 n=1 Tax=Amborella trichopoda TaxID=13333 RepID=W1P8Z1_AMBTC|nr:uncharacterized protein LOC18432553 [Amborella trichopoda]ERN04393.1 hypothetical protein AMTR_s00147p00102480 [Amborella trichopoda]|eukprot:XP_006842718.1 uncharacterized protein LOC18432553 [Amborella trichopoda]
MARESDDEEDQERLIHRESTDEAKIQRSSFEIDEPVTKTFKSFPFLHRRYLLAFLLPLFLVLLYFSTDFSRFFQVSSCFQSPIDSQISLMREAELRALNLLRTQKSGLFRLFNQSFSNPSSEISSNSTASVPTNSSSNSTFSVPDNLNEKKSSPMISLGEFKKELIKQIKLSNEVEQALLSSHQFGNGSGSVNSDEYFNGFGSYSKCGKWNYGKERKTIEWKPKPNTYLFAICVSGQMSNHLICLQKHMFFAAVLGRALILPNPKFDYQYDRVIDIEHINKCLGVKAVLTFEEFSQLKKDKVRIDRLICYMASTPCYLDEEHIKKLKGLGIQIGKLEVAWKEDVKLKNEIPSHPHVSEITEKFSCKDEVLAVGDLFYANVEEEWVMQPGGPVAHKCKTIIQPNRLIILTAQRFIQTFLGENFMALHFRRHGFLKFCNAKQESCFFPIPQAADCILRKVQRADTPVIYLSTDAAESETNLLQLLTVVNGKTVPLVKRPSHNSVEKWDALLVRHHLNSDDQVDAMLDKTICALSKVFIGASGSTFTDDILRLRKDWQLASDCDEYLCQGEQPNFIAEME